MCKSKKNIWNGKIYFIGLVYVKVIRINITGGEIVSLALGFLMVLGCGCLTVRRGRRRGFGVGGGRGVFGRGGSRWGGGRRGGRG